MIGIVSAIYSSLFLALFQVAARKGYRKVSVSETFFFDAVIGVVLWIPLALLMGGTLRDFGRVLPYAILSAILSEALYFFALSKGKLALTTVIIGSYSLYTVIFSRIINGEILTSVQLMFVLALILATVIASLPKKIKLLRLGKISNLVWPFAAAIGIGLSDTISKNIINTTSSFSFLIALAIVQVPVALIYLKTNKQSIGIIMEKFRRRRNDYYFPIVGSVCNIIGTGLLWVSFNYTYASIASPITSTSAALVAFMAIFFLREKLDVRTTIGLIVTCIGTFGLSATLR